MHIHFLWRSERLQSTMQLNSEQEFLLHLFKYFSMLQAYLVPIELSSCKSMLEMPFWRAKLFFYSLHFFEKGPKYVKLTLPIFLREPFYIFSIFYILINEGFQSAIFASYKWKIDANCISGGRYIHWSIKNTLLLL